MAEIRIEFFQTGTQTPVTISNLVAHFYDVDNLQSVEVDGVQSYALAPLTILTTTSASSGAVRFSELNNVGTSGGSSYTIGRASVTFSAAPAVTYRIFMNQANTNSNASFEVDFSVGVPWLDGTGPVTPTITPAPPSLSPSTQLVTGISGCPIAMSPPVASNFGGSVSFVSTSGTSPAGLSFASNSGVFSGTPTAASTSTVHVTATGSVSGSATSTVVFNVTDAAMTLSPASQTVTGTQDTAIAPTSALTAATTCGNVSYAITSGTLPSGLSLDASTGAITGTPAAASTATVTITATDSISRIATTLVTFNISGSSSNPPPPPTPASSATTTTVVPSTTTTPPTTRPPTSTTTPTTAPPAPVAAADGDLPALRPTDTLVTEDGQPVAVELVVENDEALVLRSLDFELRLRGACTTGCTIVEDTTGRETIHLDRNGGARVSGFGFLPGSLVHVWIFSEPRYLGALLVAPDGTYEGTFPLTDIDVGSHTLQANGFSFDNVPRSANLGIVVVDNAPAPTPGSTALPATGTTTGTVALWAALLTLIGGIILTARRTRQA
jgi:LPXTG-motif cell wall-anchored protein